MTKETERKAVRRPLPWWTRLLLVLVCTALCALLAWVCCEHIATPRYADTVRATLTITDTESLMTGGDSSFTTRSLNIRGALLEELGSVGSKNKGLFYRNISDAIQGAGGDLIKPRELKDMVSVSDDPEDETR